MPHPLTSAYRFVRGDGSLTLAVLVLAIYIFVIGPLIELGLMSRLPAGIAFAAFLALGALFVFEPKPMMQAFLALLAVTVAMRVADALSDARWIAVADAAASMAAAGALCALFLARALRDGRINAHRIIGSLGAFLLIGVIFMQAYRLLALEVADAFAIGGAPATAATLLPQLGYFSFITLTSLGFGDITPLHPFARALAALEALTGQIFLAVMVARLVGMEIEWQQEKRRRARELELAAGEGDGA